MRDFVPKLTQTVPAKPCKPNTPGRTLDPQTRGFMEARFGHDFGRVRIHSDGRAAQSARVLNASAYTVGRDIVFGAGEFATSSDAGRRLLAHELTHVAQQDKGGNGLRKSRISDVGDPAEREAQSVAGRAAAGERVTVSQAPSAAIHRDIKDASMAVPLGNFAIDMTAVQAVGGLTGEDGTLSFKPNAKAPDSKSIRLSQAVKTFNVATGADADYSKVGAGEEANRNKMQTTGADKVHVTVKGETLKTIARKHYGEPSRFTEIFDANKAVLDPSMKTADGGKSLPAKLSLTIPKAVGGGYFIDHKAADPKAKVRATKHNPEVPQDYVWPGEEVPGKNQHGSKAGKKIVAASLQDPPQTTAHILYTFETVARSEDAGIHYGTVHWSFEADGVKGVVSKETHRVAPGVSDTYRAALDEFTKFYKNPHTVMLGETLKSIAEKYYGDPLKSGEIFKANKDKIKDPDKIKPGLKLNIPIIGP